MSQRVPFKKKPKSNQKSRIRLSFEEEDDDDQEQPSQPVFEEHTVSYISKTTREAKTTHKTKSQPFDFSKYTLTKSLNELLSDPEEKPIIANLDDFEKLQDIPGIPVLDTPPKKYVPKLAHDDGEKEFLRKLANDIGTEYDDKFNYDDGTEQPDKPVVQEYDNDIDIEEEPMTQINQDKYDLEIMSEEEDSDLEVNKKVEPVKILTLDEHMKVLIESLNNLETNKRETSEEIARVKREQEAIREKKSALLLRLSNLR